MPFLLQTAASHTLGLSSTSSKWDLRTELITKLIRNLMSSPKPSPISKQQHLTTQDPGIKGRLWISKVTIPPPERDVLQSLLQVIDALTTGQEVYTVPSVAPVTAEWTGFRSSASHHQPRPDLTERQHYDRLMAETTSPVTVLYFHGGAYYLMDCASHRPVCARIARLTGGRCLSVRYRLAPQHPFPSALLDALIAYLSLLSPPPGSFHAAVPARHVVFAGDSSGGGLALALVQLLLQLQGQTIRFHGSDVSLDLPAGVAANSPWVDITRGLPSVRTNIPFDYLPEPPTNEHVQSFPPCPAWPTTPPRGDLLCDVSMLAHPLVSPAATRTWAGAPPLWMVYGTETLLDEGKVLARRAAAEGVPVVWSEYEAMPHCFAMVVEHLSISKGVFREWTQFMTDVVEGKEISTHGKWIQAKTGKEVEVDVKNLLPELDEEDVERLMREAKERRWSGREGEGILLPKL